MPLPARLSPARSRVPGTLAALTLAALLALPAAAQDSATADPAPAAEDLGPDNAGAYLASRAAVMAGDFRDAEIWQNQALTAAPDDIGLLQGLVLTRAALGDFEGAAAAARHLRDIGAGFSLGALSIIVQQGREGDFTGILADKAALDSTGPLTADLITGWAEFGMGRMSEAQAAFDRVAAMQGMEAFGLFHKAMALAAAGDFEGADQILSGKDSGPINLNRRGIFAHAQILSQLERNPDALARVDAVFGTDSDPMLDALRQDLTDGKTLPFDIVTNASQGMAEVFFTLATAMRGQTDDTFTLMNARAAAALRPDFADAILLAGGILEERGQPDLAAETYATVPPTAPEAYMAGIGQAGAAQAAGRPDEAVALLTGLTQTYPDLYSVHLALAETLRQQERFAEAIPAYDAAIALVPQPTPAHFALYFSRGIAKERTGDFDGAVADFRKALDLQPGQPQVLNYLGYSWVDRGENLDEALAMIQQAVQAQPDAGYIIDSLAWAYFRLGRYQEALDPMERASLLEPVDPIVTDHLGDVYWMNGRQREARFQWHRALSFEPTEKDADRIRRKLDIGLDAVMAEEAAGAAPAVEAPAPAPAEDSADGDAAKAPADGG